MLQVFGEDVRGVGEEVGPHVGGGRTGQLLHVLGQLVLAVAPGEVRVGLVEAHRRQRRHHGGLGERLGQEEHIRVGPPDIGEQPVPEPDRLGVRVVHPEDPDSVAHPQPDDPVHLRVDAFRVVVEIDRVDVLVLLRRVFRVGDRAVRPAGEPFRVLAHPWVVRRALQRQVDRDLHAEVAGLRDEHVEVREGAEVGMDRVVAALGRADRPGRARVTRVGCQRVVAALAMGETDRVHRREVHNVESHVSDRRQPLGRRPERARHRLAAAHRVVLHALGTREELVPRPEERTLPVGPHRHPGRPGDQLA